jgi:membrane protease YdiL (CAAX protease family)
MAFALVFRALDIFVLRLDEQIGEIILSKSLGFILVAAYTWWVGETLAAIGIHSRRVIAALSIGAGLTGVAFVIAGIVQAVALSPGDQLTVVATDPKTGMAGGAGFAALLILGNLINAFMEEGLFRGVMLPHFLQRLRFPAANVLQAALFSAWHLVWPIKSYLAGDVSLRGALARGGLLLLGTFVAGLIYGYLFWRTGSLWAPWAAHFVNNTILNLLQVRSAAGDLQPATLLSVVAVVVLALLVLALGPIVRRLHLPQLKPWGMSLDSSRAV